MKTNKTLLLVIFLLMGVSALAQQDARILVARGQDPGSIVIKWFTPTVFNLHPVNVFRKETRGDWGKLNGIPIERKENYILPPGQSDPMGQKIAESLKDIDPNNMHGLYKLNLIAKSVESALFSEFLGVYFKDETARSGKTYQYKVTLVKPGGDTDMVVSQPVSAGPFRPIAPPLNVVFDFDEKNRTIRLGWQSESLRYFANHIYRTSNSTGVRERISKNPVFSITSQSQDTTGNTFYFKDDSLIVGESYTYEVVGIDFFGRESKPSKKIKANIRNLDPPPSPEAVTSFQKGGEITITWADSSVIPGRIAGYDVFVSRKVDGPYEKVNKKSISPGTGAFTYQVGEPGFWYVEVRSVSPEGIVSPAYPVMIQVSDTQPPEAPKGLQASGDAGKITLTWKPNKEKDLAGYRLFRFAVTENGVEEYTAINGDLIQGETFTDNLPIVAKNTFDYKIVALDTTDNQSPLSVSARSSMPDVTGPQAPVIKTVKVDGDKATVNWIPSRSGDVSGYKLFRQEGETFKEISSGMIAAESTTYTVSGLPVGEVCLFALRAFDDQGNPSENSNIYRASSRTVPDSVGAATKPVATYDRRNNSVKVTWKVVPNPNLVGSMVFRKAEDGFRVASAMIPEKPIFIDLKIEPGQVYTYQVRTYYKDGQKTQSIPVEINIPK